MHFRFIHFLFEEVCVSLFPDAKWHQPGSILQLGQKQFTFGRRPGNGVSSLPGFPITLGTFEKLQKKLSKILFDVF